MLRSSKYEEELSDNQLGINERELHSMNKHIPGKNLKQLTTSSDFFGLHIIL